MLPISNDRKLNHENKEGERLAEKGLGLGRPENVLYVFENLEYDTERSSETPCKIFDSQ
jgi:hypothetical protein